MLKNNEYLTAYNDYAPNEFQIASLNFLRERAKQSARRNCYIVPAEHIFTDREELRCSQIVVVPVLDRKINRFDAHCPDIHVEYHTDPDGRSVGCLMLADDAIALNLLAVYYADVQKGEDLHVLWLFDDVAALSTYRISEEEETMYFVELMRREDYKRYHSDEQFNDKGSFIGVFDFVDLTEELDFAPQTTPIKKTSFFSMVASQLTQLKADPILQDAGIYI